MVSGLPAIAAMPTAIMAPEINPPGRCAHKNSVPPTVPIASVSSTLRVLVRLGMANAIDAGIWLTPPYDKSLHRGQMRQRDCSNARFYLPLKRGGRFARQRSCAPAQTGRGSNQPASMTGTPTLPLAGREKQESTEQVHFGLSAAAFLPSDMNFLRSLPWMPLVSASFEHSSDAAVRGFSAFFSAGAIFGAGAVFAVGAGVAGAVVCANAELIKSRDAKAVAAAREDIVIMGAPRVEEGRNVALQC